MYGIDDLDTALDVYRERFESLLCDMKRDRFCGLRPHSERAVERVPRVRGCAVVRTICCSTEFLLGGLESVARISYRVLIASTIELDG